MSRYRQQLKRVRAQRAPEIVAEIASRSAVTPRQVRADGDLPADAVPGEVFEVVADNRDGFGERPVARVRLTDGLFGRRLVIER